MKSRLVGNSNKRCKKPSVHCRWLYQTKAVDGTWEPRQTLNSVNSGQYKTLNFWYHFDTGETGWKRIIHRSHVCRDQGCCPWLPKFCFHMMETHISGNDIQAAVTWQQFQALPFCGLLWKWWAPLKFWLEASKQKCGYPPPCIVSMSVRAKVTLADIQLRKEQRKACYIRSELECPYLLAGRENDLSWWYEIGRHLFMTLLLKSNLWAEGNNDRKFTRIMRQELSGVSYIFCASCH